jgi:hypothetical protein
MIDIENARTDHRHGDSPLHHEQVPQETEGKK